MNMQKRNAFLMVKILPLLFLLLCFLPTTAQTPPTNLQSGKTLEQTIESGETQTFQTKLVAGEFLRVEIVQPNVGVDIKFFDTDGKELNIINNFSAFASAYISYEAEKTGDYRLEITRTDTTSLDGKYIVKPVVSEKATADERTRMAAERLFIEIGDLRDKGGQESVEKSNSLSEQLLATWRKLGDKYWEAVTLNDIGRIYDALGNNQKALEYFNQALPIRRIAGDKRGEAVTFRNIGNNFSQQREYEKAIDAYQQSIAIYKLIGHKNQEASISSELANVYDAENEMQKAIALHLQSAEIYKSLNDIDNQADELNNVGWNYNFINDFERAVLYFNQSVELYKITGSNDTRTNYDGLGEAYNNLDNFPQAIASLSKAAELHRAEKDVPSEAGAIEKIARINRNQGELKLALEQFMSAVPLRIAENDSEALGNLYSNIGLIQRTLGNDEQAQEFFKKALPFYIIGDDGKPIDAAKVEAMLKKASAQTKPPLVAYKNQTLTEGLRFEREIKAGETAHSYNVKLKKGEYLHVETAQIGVDVIVALFNKTNKKLVEVDSPNGTSGFESLSFEAAANGAYRIEVKTLAEKAVGKYELYVEALRSPTNIDKTRILAERAFAEGQLLQKKAKEQNNSDEQIIIMQQAVVKFNEVRKLWENINYLFGQKLANEAIVYCYYEFNRRLAIPFAREVLAFDRITKNHESEFQLLKSISWYISTTWQKDVAIEFVEDRLFLAKYANVFAPELNSPSIMASAFYEAGVTYGHAGRDEKGLSYYQEAFELRKAIDDKKGQARILLSMGKSSVDTILAIEYFNQSSLVYLSLEDFEMASEAKSHAGSFYLSIGQTQKGLDALIESLSILKKTKVSYAEKHNSSKSWILKRIGDCYKQLGNYADALNSYNNALVFSQKITKGEYLSSSKETQNEIYGKIASIYDLLGDKRKALQYYEKPIPYFLSNPEFGIGTALLINAADFYSKISENQKAIELYEQSLKNLRTLNIFFQSTNETESDIFSRIAGVKLKAGETQKAIELLEKAEELNKTNVRKNALIFQTYADVYVRLGDVAKAVDYYHQALGVYRGEQNRSGEAAVLSELTNVSQTAGNARLAIFYGKQSINKYQELRQNIESLDKDTQKTYLKSVEDVYKKLADILVGEGRFAEAQNVLALLKDQEYYDYVRRDADEIKNLTKTHTELNDNERKVLERYNLFANRVTEIGAEFQTLDDKKRKLSEGTLLPLDEQKRYDELAAQLKDANDAFKIFLEKELTAEFAKTDKKQQIIDDRALINKLRGWGAGTVLLTTVLNDNRYRVILTTSKVQVDGKYEIPIADLNKKIFAFRDVLQNPNLDPRPLGKELYDILIKPIEKDLAAADAKTLIWSLDGTLRYIPLAALSPDGKSYLVEKYQTAVITSTARQDLLANDKPEWRTLGVGVSNAETVADPTAPDNKISFAALPGVISELTAIVRDEQAKDEGGITLGKKYVDADFNEKNFSDSLTKETEDGKRKYTVVHIASHFRLGGDTANSFLLLGSGKTLTLEQISNSPEMTFENVELVTLSACNTAFGNDTTGKEVDSLATFIMARGAKSVMATLWAVADNSTQLMMSGFYRIRKENPNHTKAETIQAAQLLMIRGEYETLEESARNRSDEIIVEGISTNQPKLKRDKMAPFSHPYYWSPFILIGNWR